MKKSIFPENLQNLEFFVEKDRTIKLETDTCKGLLKSEIRLHLRGVSLQRTPCCHRFFIAPAAAGASPSNP